ncbi:ABC transporter substrate-binding protein [Yangia mangrovi]|uniref:Thiamine pyrimidine synthase n=1 Tax=Alloyangia mangrovi TaxID=1779329 RepID=A0ABT2KH14_9RHOB|nr:ABC transporter substrate-binding protein [Alloyangia mangrovi]MCA0942537.1 ABC transporter substrate-binding protein [Alloyangia pacifica]MCA0946157.1 ABC transporter substrate-binding protein [Alloyangia pacifica]MCT4368998.1 ABC transporter substrate-binding protein [Alloyangia mangrovi]
MTFLTPTRRLFLGGALSTAGAALFAPPRARAQDAVALQLSWLHSVQFGGSYIAQDKGYWRDAGLEVSLLPGGPNAPVEPPVVAGTALVGISAADYTAAAVNQGAPFRIIGVAMQKNPFAIASLPANPVNSPADLVGKKLGMALANTPVLEALCTVNGVDIDQIEVVPTQYDAAPLVQGQVDCLLCWATDLPVAMEIQGVESVTMLLADHGYAVHSQTYIATEDSLANRRDQLVALMRGEVMGWQDYHADPEEAAALTVDMFPDAGLDLATQKLQAERQVPLMFSELTETEGFGWFTDETVAANVETLRLLGKPVSSDLWDRSILEEVHG